MSFLKPNTDEDGAEDGHYRHPADYSTTNSRSSVEMEFDTDDRTGSRTQRGRHHPEPAGTDDDTETETEPNKTAEYFVFNGG